MPYPTTLAGAPWKRAPATPWVILTADNQPAAVATLGRAADTVAQAMAALPQLLEAAHAAINAIDVLFPGWSDADIRDKETEADTIIEARRLLRAALRRANNLHADGTPAQPGEYP